MLLFASVVIFNFYFLGWWIKMFIEVLLRLNIKELERRKGCRSCLRRFNIDDYKKSLKKQRQKHREE